MTRTQFNYTQKVRLNGSCSTSMFIDFLCTGAQIEIIIHLHILIFKTTSYIIIIIIIVIIALYAWLNPTCIRRQ